MRQRADHGDDSTRLLRQLAPTRRSASERQRASARLQLAAPAADAFGMSTALKVSLLATVIATVALALVLFSAANLGWAPFGATSKATYTTPDGHITPATVSTPADQACIVLRQAALPAPCTPIRGASRWCAMTWPDGHTTSCSPDVPGPPGSGMPRYPGGETVPVSR